MIALEVFFTYRDGIAAVIAVIFGLLVAISLLDLVCELMDWPSIGYRVQGWARRNPWFVLVLLLGFTALLAHFVANTP